jgi:C4-dicarboxylate-specific signal transduction histidine kinase
MSVRFQEIFRMRKLTWLAVFITLAIWIVMLQRRLQAARMRGDMYRDISARLDRRVVELTKPGQ